VSIQEILAGIYGDSDMSRGLAERLEQKITNWQPYYPDETREDMIREVCWMWFSGGGTAAIAAKRIEAMLLDNGSPSQ
jgi:hypothetical protein